MSLGRCHACDKRLTPAHMATVDAQTCAECLAENRTQVPLVKPRILARIISRYAGTCARCHGRLRAGVLIGYEPATRQAFHAMCADDIEAADERQVLPL